MIELIAIFIICCVLIVIAAININKSKNSENTAWKDSHENIINKINSTYFIFFDKSTGSVEEKLDQLYTTAKRTLDETKESYFTKNAIKETYDTFSDLKLCGVSESAFYINVNKVTSDEIYTYGNLKQTYNEYTSVMNRVHGSFTYPQDRWRLEHGIIDALPFYTKLKNEGCTSKAERIPLENIVAFRVEGNRHISTSISDGGPNLKGAAAGALIGGEAGAIIGSRVGVQQISTTTTIDERKILLIYVSGGTVVTRQIQSAEKDKTIDALRKLIPQKEESVVKLNAVEGNHFVQSSAADELKKFKDLLDTGVISQEEFDAKKKQLLDL